MNTDLLYIYIYWGGHFWQERSSGEGISQRFELHATDQISHINCI